MNLDELEKIREENRYLTIITTEDAEEIKRLKTAWEICELENGRLHHTIEEQERFIKKLQNNVFQLEQVQFKADVAAKTAAKEKKDISAFEDEQALLQTQVEIDSQTISSLRRELNLIAHERDQLAARIMALTQAKEEAEENASLLDEHSMHLRASNANLANQLAALKEQIETYEEEDYAQWFTRKSRRDIANGALGKKSGVHSQQQQPQLVGQPPTTTPTQRPFSSHTSLQTEKQSPYSTSKYVPVPIRDALSGQIVSDAGTEMLDVSPVKGARMSLFTPDAKGGAGRPISTSSEDFPLRTSAPFQTIRQLRQGAKVHVSSEGTHHHHTLPEVYHERPATSPLVIEAIYGEKVGENGEKMYLVKFVSVEAEQWTRATFVDRDCEALALWKRRSRAPLSNNVDVD